MKHRNIINLTGNILMLLSFAFIINRVLEYGVDFTKITTSVQTFIVLIIAVFIYGLSVISFAFIFYLLLKIFNNNNVPKMDSILIYCKSNLYKYLPGNIFHYIGRNEVAFNNGIAHSVAITATIAEVLLLALAAVITATTLAGKYAAKWALDNFVGKEIFGFSLLIVLILLTGIILNKVNSKKIGAYNIRAVNNLRLRDAMKFVSLYTIGFISNGVMFILVLHSLGGGISIILFLPVIGMYTFAWLVGFITPGAPAGLGIREVIMSTFLIGIVEAEFVISAVIVYRIITILGDVVAFIMVHQLSRKGICQRFAPSFIFRLTR